MIVVLQRVQRRLIDIADMSTLEDRTVPGAVAIAAAIDQPGVQPPAIGIEPRLAARRKRPCRSAAIAGEPGAWRDFRRDGPLDQECVRHVVWFFRLEVHQDDGLSTRSGDAVWQRFGDGSVRTKNHAATGRQCHSGLEPSPRRTH
ncbi:hypothetical protein D3C87_1634810 [compost metagenome]